MPWYKEYSYLYIPALFLITAIFLDVIMYAAMGLPFASDYIYSLVIMVIIASLFALTQRKWLQIVFASIMLGIQLFTCISNIISYVNLSEIFSWENVMSIVNAIIASKSTSINLWFLFPIILVMSVYVIGVIIICIFCKRPVVKHKIVQPLLCLVMTVVALFVNLVGYVSLPNYDAIYVKNLSNKKFLFDTFANRVQSLKMFGSYNYYFNNLLFLLSVLEMPTKALGIEVNPEFVPDTTGYDRIAPLGEGNNLIMILLETFEKAAINQYLTPNLWEFVNTSCTSVNGYYSIERTCFTDYISQTGTQVLGKETWASYGDVEIPFSLGNIFKRSGYVTNAFHNGSGDMYKRNKVFTTSLGFDHFYDYRTLDEQHDFCFNYNKDEEMFAKNLEKIAPADENFYSFLITISTHGVIPQIKLQNHGYSAEFAEIEKYQAELAAIYPWLNSDDPDKVQIIKNYLAGANNFDKGFGLLLDRLRETDDAKNPGKKLIDTTAIMLFGDHYYYLNPCAVVPEDDNPAALIGNQCPFIVYNPADKTHKEVNRFTATMDIYKTACSMFGVATDKQLTYGNSVLHDLPTPSIGVGYVNGYIWGQTADGQKWRTVDFINFDGKVLTETEIKSYTPLITQTFNAIIANMILYNEDGFKNLDKCKQYKLRKKLDI